MISQALLYTVNTVNELQVFSSFSTLEIRQDSPVIHMQKVCLKAAMRLPSSRETSLEWTSHDALRRNEKQESTDFRNVIKEQTFSRWRQPVRCGGSWVSRAQGARAWLGAGTALGLLETHELSRQGRVRSGTQPPLQVEDRVSL